jgi:flavin-dependent dehydrogenase
VTGVAGHTLEWTADLVVDATGRGSRTPVFLQALGYDRPCEKQISIGLAYTSQPLRFRSDMRPEAVIASFPKHDRQVGYSLWANEDDTWMFGLATIGGVKPPAERSGMLDLVEELAPTELAAKLRSAEPLGEVARHGFPSSRWRRYDKMRRTPEGLIVVGDALCSFNPIYGQGITVAALEAVALRECLSEGLRDLPNRFFRSTVKTIAVAWQTAAASDLPMSKATASQNISMRIMNAYMERVLTAAESSPVVAEQLMRVTGMVDSPSRLMRPGIWLRFATFRRGRFARGQPLAEA